MPEPQNFKNHRQLVPGFLAVGAILAINVVWALYTLIQDVSGDSLVSLLVAVALVVLGFSFRGQVLTVQDRVIRNEMHLRLARVLPQDLGGQIGRLTRQQLVGLRFASDAELPTLVREVLAGSVTSLKDIKMRVRDWQADYLRA